MCWCFADELLGNLEHMKTLLAMLEPDWLKLKLLHSLLDDYDPMLVQSAGCLLPDPALDLPRVVTHYFYVLPPLKQLAPASPHKKVVTEGARPKKFKPEQKALGSKLNKFGECWD